jgi:chromosomal replication initiator protein
MTPVVRSADADSGPLLPPDEIGTSATRCGAFGLTVSATPSSTDAAPTVSTDHFAQPTPGAPTPGSDVWVGDYSSNPLLAWLWGSVLGQPVWAWVPAGRTGRWVPDRSGSFAPVGPPAGWPWVFTGPSGIGKSTWGRLLLEAFRSTATGRCPDVGSSAPSKRPSKTISPSNLANQTLSVGDSGLADLDWTIESPRDGQPAPFGIFVTGKDFRRGYHSAVSINQVPAWRRRLDPAPVCIIDDLTGLVGDAVVQQQLSELIDLRADRRLPTIVLSRETPRSLDLCPRLLSRLLGGLFCPMLPPGHQAASVLILTGFQRLGIPIESQQVQLLISLGVIHHATIQQLANRWLLEYGRTPFNWPSASDSLREMVTGSVAAPRRPESILKATAKCFRLTVADLRGPSRTAACARARAVAMWLCRQQLGLSYQQIGSLFGHRDHTTVISSCRRIDASLADDSFLQSAVNQIVTRLGIT